jgi:GcrA cell cycle regulator
MSAWNEGRVETLTMLWAKGWSASQIATRLGGVTRNAVIGKAHRLGLPDRKGKNRYRQASSKSRTCNRRRQTPLVHPWKLPPSKPLRLAEQAPEAPQSLPEPAPLRLTLLDLRENTCRWPIGDPQDENFHFCGCQTSGIGPYCDYHAQIAHQPYVRRPKR